MNFRLDKTLPCSYIVCDNDNHFQLNDLLFYETFGNIFFEQYLNKVKEYVTASCGVTFLVVFISTEKRLTVLELYECTNVRYTDIGYAAAYRAMQAACNARIAEEIVLGDGLKYYEHKFGQEHHAL